MKNENYIVIQGWMVNELQLSGNELLCYALIYGFSQDGESCFKGSRKYISQILGVSSLNTVDKTLANLIDKNLIAKDSCTINGVVFNTYKTNLNTAIKNEYPVQKMNTPYSNFEHNINSNNNRKEEKDLSFSKKKQKDELFEQCWVAYQRKGSKGKAKPYWDKLTDDEKTKVKKHIPHYVSSVSEIKYIKDFERYLKDKIFLNVVYKNNVTLFDPDDNNTTTDNDTLIINGVCYK